MDILFTVVYYLGLTAILCWVVFGLGKYIKKHPLPDLVQEIISFILILGMLFGGSILLDSAKKSLIENHRKTQTEFCLNTRTKNGDSLTEAQCNYFQNVLDGVYSELDGDYSDNYSY